MSDLALRAELTCVHAEKRPIISPYAERQIDVTLETVEPSSVHIVVNFINPSGTCKFEKGKKYRADFTLVE